MKKLLVYSLIVMLVLPEFSCINNRRRGSQTSTQIQRATNDNRIRHSGATKGKAVITMRKEGGVYHIPCKINGTEMEFIFDTGASSITMSLTEAKFLYKQGKLTKGDFRDTQLYQTADGSIHEGMVVILRSVEIGNSKLQNIEASIMDNEEAPLLLGQSALAAFGKISIDYKRNEITFE